MIEADVIVVGSGASGAHAAYALAEAGVDVVLVDVGERDRKYAGMIPSEDFLTIRRTDEDQHRYFLGDNFEGVPFGPVKVGAQLTPPRQHLMRRADELVPALAGEFAAVRSFSLGGLAAGWGAGAFPYIQEELEGFAFTRADIQRHYDRVTERIGVCGNPDDDLAPLLGPSPGLLPPARFDSNGASVFRRYDKKRASLRVRGLAAGEARLALCTRQHRGRGPAPYDDMDFWSDHSRAVYRAQWTIDELENQFPSFRYVPGVLAETFAEDAAAERVTLRARALATGDHVEFRARRLILAAGTFCTARIVLESLGAFGRAVPIVANPYTYFPALNLSMVGHAVEDRRHSLSQICFLYDPDGTRANMLSTQLYSYRSLMLFKLIKESPLAHRESIRVFRGLSDYLVIFGLHHPDRPSEGKTVSLRAGSGDQPPVLDVAWREPAGAEAARRKLEKTFVRFARALRCIPLGTVRPGPGSSIHYGGTFPYRAQGGDLACDVNGRLGATKFVHLADGSTFPHLPAKGLTLTLMANADRIGCAVARMLK